jgi:HlyD family secretion protein
MKPIQIITLIALLSVSCGKNKNKSDAYGNFEAVEVMVGAEAQGKLLWLNIEEGQQVASNAIVGLVDTFALYLKKEQLNAQKDAALSRIEMLQSQVNVQEEQKQTLKKEQDRIQNLINQNAVPTKQLDDINGQLNVLEKQITASKTQNASIINEVRAIKAQIAQMNDQINKSLIRNPIDGIVLEKYAEQGEIISPSKNIYKIANLSIIQLRVYVSGDQLPSVKLGAKVKVIIDNGNKETKDIEGTVSWISQQAEFTPKIIQTKKERVNLVYAVKINVINDGTIKIGMPGEVNF